MQRDAEGRVAVVTGGAQSIGQAFALRLARDGHRVAIADLQPTDETERLIAEAGGESFGLECDISSRESVGAFADAVRERFGRCDVLVASAGIYPVIPFAELEWEDWRRILAVNVDSLFHLSKAFVPGMIENGWGRVIAVSSTTFHTGTPSVRRLHDEQGRRHRLRARARDGGRRRRRHGQLGRPVARPHAGHRGRAAGAARLVRPRP